MASLEALGRLLLVAGAALFVLGLVFVSGARLPFLGHLPGDLSIEWGGATIFVPITTMLLVSLVLSLLLGLLGNRNQH